MGSIFSAIKHVKARELAGLTGRLIGFGLFVGLILTYCHVLLETCFRGLK
jgi:hypothetical protein